MKGELTSIIEGNRRTFKFHIARLAVFTGLQALLTMVNAQPPVAWQKLLGGSMDDKVFSFCISNDQSYIIAATTESINGDLSTGFGASDIWIFKLSEDGEIVWQKRIGGTGVDVVSKIRKTNDGGLILVGNTFSTDGIGVGNHGSSDILIVKLNSTGNIQWQKLLGGINNDYGHDILQCSDGSFLAVGGSCCHFGDDEYFQGEEFWAARVNTNGLLEWEKTFGGNLGDRAYSVAENQAGNFWITGNSDSYLGQVTNNFGGDDVWVIEISKQGNLLQQRTFGGSGIEYLSYLQIDNAGGYYLLTSTKSVDGDVSGQHGHFDLWLSKISDSDEILWQKCLGGSDADYASSLALAHDGAILVSAWTYSSDGDLVENHGDADAWLAKLNSNGELVWSKTFGGSEFETFYSFQEVSNETFLAAGVSNSMNGDLGSGHGKADAWIMKLSDVSSVQPDAVEPNFKELKVYPNPANCYIKIELPAGIIPNLAYISDLLGRVEYDLGGKYSQPIDISRLTEGLHFVKMQDNAGKTYMGKFFKMH